MCCVKDSKSVLRGVAVVVLLLAISLQPGGGCQNCQNSMSRIERSTELTEVTIRRIPLKKDVFMSRGWGAGGGTAFTSRANSECCQMVGIEVSTAKLLQVELSEQDWLIIRARGSSVSSMMAKYLLSAVRQYTSHIEDLHKKNRVVEMLVNDDDEDGGIVGEPRAEFLQSPKHVARPIASRRRLPNYIPQLFISSGWGPLGK